ncbi:hypothetical protein Q7P37_010350 [Cladosporium fusiforme]
MLVKVAIATLACVANLARAQVVGSASGAATGVTGGGDATPAAPANIDELVEWLTDDEPRVILIDQEFDFTGSEGIKTENGCRPDSNTCGSSGQDALGGPDWCSDSYPIVEVTYDVAGASAITVASNKSIVGVGDKGVVRGKGFRVVNGASNVIFQNFHITELNPQYIWGGDAIQIRNTDMVWVDHMKFSLVGRQMLVVQNDAGGRATISNNEFDGETSWSASCNGQHYWTMMIIGEGDQVTLANNWLHSTSGRSPKVGKGTSLHAVNNFFENNEGHNFDAEDGAKILIEGNVFKDCKAPLSQATLSHSSGIFNVPSADDAASCAAALGRDCETNSLSESGEFGSFTDTAAVEAVSAMDSVWEAVSVDQVSSSNAGVGKLESSSTADFQETVLKNRCT